MRALLVLAAVAALAGAAIAQRDYCSSEGQPALGIIQVTGGTAGSTYYIDDRNWALGNGIYLYEESNGLWTPKPAGVYVGDPQHVDLQRGGWCSFTHCTDEFCWDEASTWNGPDWLIYV